MRAVICSINSNYIHMSPAPYCLLAGLRAYGGEGISAEIVEGTVNEGDGALWQRILEKQPDVLSFCCYIWNIEMVCRLGRMIKRQRPEMVLILGGPEVGYRPAAFFEGETWVDFVVSGEGEYPFARLLSDLQAGKNPAGSDGICGRGPDGTVLTAPPYISNEDPPSPYTQDYLERLKGRIAYLETSRGCPYSCAFCLSGRCGGVRFFDLEQTKKKMLLLANSGAKTVKLVDRTFNAHRQRAREIFSFLIRRYGKEIPAGVRFHFEIAGDILDDKTMEVLRTAPRGAIQFEIGMQSFHERTLEKIRRRTDTDALCRNIRRLVEFGNIHIHLDLIAGLPLEDLACFAEGFDKGFFLRPHMLQLGFLKLLYGSPMRENREEYPCTAAAAPPYQVLETPWISRKEMEGLSRMEAVFDRVFHSGRFRGTVEYVLTATGKRPFVLFWEMGQQIKPEGVALDGLTEMLYRWFSGLPGIEQGRLRDVMAEDRIKSDRSGYLPKVLRIPDSRLKRAKRWMQARQPCPPETKRGAALLYSREEAMFCDYTVPDPVTGEYPVRRIPFAAMGLSR